MPFPATWKELREYVTDAGSGDNSSVSFQMTHDGAGNSVEPWYTYRISRVEITRRGREFVKTPYSVDFQFTGARLGAFNEPEVVYQDDCRVTVDQVRTVCQALNIPVPDRDIVERQIESFDEETGDRRLETVDSETGETLRIEFYDATTGMIVQRETMDLNTGTVATLEIFNRDNGELRLTIEDPGPGEGEGR
jgi:hypothetical protein